MMVLMAMTELMMVPTNRDMVTVMVTMILMVQTMRIETKP